MIVLEILAALLLVIGSVLMFIAALGLLRMPDIYLRMAATSKVATLGAACSMLALAVFFIDLGIIARSILTVVFLFMTAPIAAHIIGRAAYITGAQLWEGTVLDELEGRYDQRTHHLAGQQARQGLASTPVPSASTSDEDAVPLQ